MENDSNASLYCAFVNPLAAAGLSGSTSLGMFLAFRFIAVWGGRTIATAIPIRMSEVSPPKVGGISVDCQNAGFLPGYNFASYFGYIFYHVPADNNWAWRGGMVLQAFWVIVLLAGMHWLPEVSPTQVESVCSLALSVSE